MNRNFFIRLTFAVHRVADAFLQEELKQEIKEAANTVLADLIVFVEKDGVSREKKYELAHQITRQIDVLLVYLDRAKREGWVHSENFSVLELEYGRLKDFLEVFESVEGADEETSAYSQKNSKPYRKAGATEEKAEQARPNHAGPRPTSSNNHEQGTLTDRQRKIIEFLKRKDTAQVWELQKILPQVTKRTLRRDLDSLLQLDLVERKGEWNSVVYELKEKDAVA